MTLYSLALDILLAILLVIAILYCWRLDQKLRTLRAGGDSMLEAARELQVSLAQAQSAIEQLRASADGAGKDLQLRIDTARAVSEMADAPASAARRDGGLTLRRRTSA
jgi:hypothetical protein